MKIKMKNLNSDVDHYNLVFYYMEKGEHKDCVFSTKTDSRKELEELFREKISMFLIELEKVVCIPIMKGIPIWER